MKNSKEIKYKISTSVGVRSVMGIPVILPGWEMFEFFLMHPYNVSYPLPGWVVCEKTTGRRISDFEYSTQEGAIKEALARLERNKMTPAEFKECMKKHGRIE